MTRLAILGAGSMARQHARHFGQIQGVTLAACCDVQKEAARRFAEEFQIPQYFTKLTDMLEAVQIDAISNVTTDNAHYSTTMEILKHGRIHIFCEKPLATSARDATEMARAAKKTGAIHMVNFTYRNAPAIHLAHELVETGKIGRLLITHRVVSLHDQDCQQSRARLRLNGRKISREEV